MKIIFVETENEGHHITLYTRLLFKKLIKKNQIHFITSKKVINSEQYKPLKPYIKRLKIHEIKSQKKPKKNLFINILIYHLKNLVGIFIALKKIKKNYNINCIYFNYLDPYIFIFPLLNFFFNLNIKCSGLLLNIKFHQYFFNIRNYSPLDSFKFYLFKIFINSQVVSKVFIIDNQFLYFLKKKKFYSKKIININEAVTKKLYLNRVIKQKKYKKKIKILIYGSIHQRKGIHLINEINNNFSIRNKVKFTFAGKFDSKVLDYIKENKSNFKNINLINKFIDDKLESKLMSSTDLVWLCYTSGSDGSSGVMQLSALYGKPIIFSNRGLINYLGLKHKLGFKVNLQKNITDQFKSIFFKKYPKMNFRSNLKKYIKLLEKNNFEQKISDELLKKLT